MEKIKLKYAPMIIVIYFSVMGLVIAFILSVVRYFLDGTSLMKGIDAPIFMSAIAIIIGLIYCEVNYWVKNLWIGAILFGILSINLFILLLPIPTLVPKGNIGELPPLDIYLG